MVARDRVIERLTNLTFAFLNADRLGRKFLSPQWIHEHVDGYAEYARLRLDPPVRAAGSSALPEAPGRPYAGGPSGNR